MPNWDFFRWTRKPSRDIKATILRVCFTRPDASRDVCQVTDCGIIRADHSREKQGHVFKEAL